MSATNSIRTNRPVEPSKSATSAETSAPAKNTAVATQSAASSFTSASTRAAALALTAPAGEHVSSRFSLGGILGGAVDQILGPSRGQIGWMQKDPTLPKTHDVTADFKSTYETVKTGGNPLPADAKNFVYLTVDGLTGENFPGYMEANREGLRDKGLDCREIKVDTEAGSYTNAETIKKAIEQVRAEGKQVVLIGHSKGGNDIATLLALHPELKSDVRAVVTLQSPIGGAPLATDLRSNVATKLGVDALAKYIFNGNPDCVRDLTYAWRQQFMKDHPYPSDIPTVSLATSDTSQLSLVAAAADYVRLRYGEKTDGLVSPKDAFIPGANTVTLTDLDHVESTMPNLGRWDAGDLTVALVAEALKMPVPKSNRVAA